MPKKLNQRPSLFSMLLDSAKRLDTTDGPIPADVLDLVSTNGEALMLDSRDEKNVHLCKLLF
jgi:hypothetical protein